MLRTSESWPEAVIVAIQQAVQDTGEDGGVVLLLVRSVLIRAEKQTQQDFILNSITVCVTGRTATLYSAVYAVDR